MRFLSIQPKLFIGLFILSLGLNLHDGKYYTTIEIAIKLSRIRVSFRREFDYLRLFISLGIVGFEFYMAGLKRIPSKENQNG